MRPAMLACMIVCGTGLGVGMAHAQQEAAIQKLNDRFGAAFSSGDSATAVAMYAPDAVLLPAGSPMIRGHDGIAAYWQAGVQQIGQLKLTTVSARPVGADAIVDIGTYSDQPKASGAPAESGKYVVIWRKVGGDWKIAVDIWNSDK